MWEKCVLVKVMVGVTEHLCAHTLVHLDRSLPALHSRWIMKWADVGWMAGRKLQRWWCHSRNRRDRCQHLSPVTSRSPVHVLVLSSNNEKIAPVNEKLWHRTFQCAPFRKSPGGLSCGLSCPLRCLVIFSSTKRGPHQSPARVFSFNALQHKLVCSYGELTPVLRYEG